MAGVGNYFVLTPEEYETLSSEELHKISSTEDVLKEFRSLECTASGTHFGYQHRVNPNILACSAKCLAATRGLLKKVPNAASAPRMVAPVFNCGKSVERETRSKVIGLVNEVSGVDGAFSNGENVDQECGKDEPDCRVQAKEEIPEISEPLMSSKLTIEEVKVQVAKNNRIVRPKPVAECDQAQGIQSVRAAASSPAQVEVKSKGALAKAAEVNFKLAEALTKVAQGSLKLSEASAKAAEVKVNSSEASPKPAASPLAKSDPNKSLVNGIPAIKIPKEANKILDPQSETCEASKKIWTMRDMIVSLSLVNNARCAIVHTWDLVTYTINALADLDKIQQLDDAIHDHCKEAPPLTRVPKANEILLAPYQGSYYRCKVASVIDGKTVQVDFLDYGDMAVVESNKCKEPSKKIMEHPIYGIKLVLSMETSVPADFKSPAQVDAMKEKDMTLEIMSSEGWEWVGKLHTDDAKVTLNEIIEKHLIAAGAGAPKKLIAPEVSAPQASTQEQAPAAVAGSPAGAAGITAAPGTSAVAVSSPAGSKVEVMKLMDVKLSATITPRKPELKVPTLVPPKLKKPLLKPTPLAEVPKVNNAAQMATKPSPGIPKVNSSEVPKAAGPAAPKVNSPASPASPKVASPATPKADINVSRSSPTEISKKTPAAPTEKTVESPSVVQPKPNQLFAENMKLSESLYNGALVHVNFMWNYGKCTISACEDDPKLDAMTAIIDEHAAAAPAMTRQPVKDEVLLAPYQGTYYRGKVVIVNGKSVTVEFIDYGDQVTVELSECRELHPSIISHPRYGAVFIMPDVGHRAMDAKLAAPEGGQIEITDKDKKAGILYGRLWLDIENSFNEVVKATFGMSDE